MSAVEADLGGTAGQPPTILETAAVPSWRRRWRWLVTAAGLLVVALVAVLTPLAATYQPITWGGVEFDPTGVGIRPVNTFGFYREDFYVPPQRGEFTFFASIENQGSRAVIIEAVTVPQLDKGYPLGLAGPVLYSRDIPTGRAMPPHSHPLHDVTLGPAQGIFIGIRLRTPSCASTDGWTYIPSFYVKERFGFFTHTVALPWSMNGGALIMRDPGGHPGGVNTFCAPS